MFANLDFLSEYVNAWTTAIDSVKKDGIEIREVAASAHSPVDDAITTGYFAALTDTFAGFADHNGMVSEYVASYAKNLAENRDSMKASDESGASLFPHR